MSTIATTIAFYRNSEFRALQKSCLSALALITVGCFLALVHVCSDAQAVDDLSESSDPSATDNLEEVLVTARRREERNQSVPIAITAISQSQLQNNNISTIADLQYLVPSMTTASYLYNRDSINVYVRGQGSHNFGSAPGVVGYLNEVPIPSLFTGEMAGGPGLLFDLESIQVLKGPQGTLFGKNSVGGALLIQTKRPTNEFDAHVQIGYGNYANKELDGVLNGPLIADKLLARVAINWNERNGFSKVLSSPHHPNGIRADDRNYWSARVSLAFTPNNVIQNDLIATYQRYESHGSPMFLTRGAGAAEPNGIYSLLIPEFPTYLSEQLALGRRVHIPLTVDPVSAGSLLSVANHTRVQVFDDIVLRNILAYTHATSTITDDLDDSPALGIEAAYAPYRMEKRQLSEELQLQGEVLKERLSWTAGALLLDIRTPDFELNHQRTFGGTNLYVYGKSRGTTQAVFGQGAYDVSSWIEGLSITAGLRYTWDRLEDAAIGAAPSAGYCTDPIAANCITRFNRDGKFEALTWTVGLDYKLDPNTLAYLTSRRGYRAGGLNAANLPATLQTFGPEFVVDYEFGIKADWDLGTMPARTNAAIFYQDYTEVQVTRSILDTSTTPPVARSVNDNAGHARQWGAELEVLLNLTRRVRAGFNYSHLDYKFLEALPGVSGTTILAALGSNLRGSRVPNQYGVHVQYKLPVQAHLGDISLAANWSWRDESGSPGLFMGGYVPSYGLLNLAADWENILGKPLSASLFISNALDRDYIVGGFDPYNIVGLTKVRYGEPRMFGIRLRYRFDG